MNKSIRIIDNTERAWGLTEATMPELYTILNDFLTGERRTENTCVSHDKVNHLIAWLPNIDAIVIHKNDNDAFFDIRFQERNIVLEDAGLGEYFVEMIRNGEL